MMGHPMRSISTTKSNQGPFINPFQSHTTGKKKSRNNSTEMRSSGSSRRFPWEYQHHYMLSNTSLLDMISLDRILLSFISLNLWISLCFISLWSPLLGAQKRIPA